MWFWDFRINFKGYWNVFTKLTLRVSGQTEISINFSTLKWIVVHVQFTWKIYFREGKILSYNILKIYWRQLKPVPLRARDMTPGLALAPGGAWSKTCQTKLKSLLYHPLQCRKSIKQLEINPGCIIRLSVENPSNSLKWNFQAIAKSRHWQKNDTFWGRGLERKLFRNEPKSEAP